MTEHGFFHPDRGYWQAVSHVPDEVLAAYPEGTIEVPLKPGADFEWTGAEWALQPKPLANLKSEKVAALASKRWQVETGGIVVGGATIATDRESQSLIDGAYAGALRHPGTVIKFKGVDGWVTLDAATMIAIGDAVFFHVQACFAREEELAAAIDAAADEPALDTIDIEVGWPA